MLKYLLGFALVFGLAVYVAVKDERAAQQSAQETAQSSKSTVPAVADADHPQQHVPNTERDLPSWYGFFRWPNGTTTWAILLTLLAIAEQTKETSKSAEAALMNAKALINSERPWVMIQIRTETFPQGEEPSSGIYGKGGFQFQMFNYGKGPAHILDCRKLKFAVIQDPDKNLPIPPRYGSSEWNRTFLPPRDSLPIDSLFNPNERDVWTSAEQMFNNQRADSNLGDLAIYGFIEYSDGVAPKTYKTAFCYRFIRNRLIPGIGGRLLRCGPSVYNEYT